MASERTLCIFIVSPHLSDLAQQGFVAEDFEQLAAVAIPKAVAHQAETRSAQIKMVNRIHHQRLQLGDQTLKLGVEHDALYEQELLCGLLIRLTLQRRFAGQLDFLQCD